MQNKSVDINDVYLLPGLGTSSKGRSLFSLLLLNITTRQYIFLRLEITFVVE